MLFVFTIVAFLLEYVYVDIIFPGELTETILPTINNIKNLELQIESSTATTQKILDAFIWILPGLKTLSLTCGSISKIIEDIDLAYDWQPKANLLVSQRMMWRLFQPEQKLKHKQKLTYSD
ncbi:hypothetical protein K7X08_019283 [Anisodus acutangulus]|uniref:Uncharacterized protein n=1 Tax=Anisodus acutangulus TaxID=402998 RepID=A0A9Q1RPN4_9SOLA|nr:hypothetical protein K7X08_019283 [Anisodus acutangulus]